MNIIFFDDQRNLFLPLVYTKPIAKLRVGILTIEEKWKHHFLSKNISTSLSFITEPYLSKKYPLHTEQENIFINSRFFPNERLVDFIVNHLIAGEALFYEKTLVVAKCTLEQYQSASYYVRDSNESLFSIELKTITDLFSKNEIALTQDFELITKGRKSATISSTNTIIGNTIFLEEGAKVEASILNSTFGPIYIGKDAEIMEGCLVRGSLALCEHGVLKMGAKIYGATTIGKYSKVGGEVNNAVIQDYSNKGHDGFLGNSIIGEWCNLGADTNTSNLKNNYAEVKIWSFEKNKFEKTGLQFCGLIMGDHSKCSINTMFNTGTVVGISANIFGSGFPQNFVPSYSWGGATGFTIYQLDKVFEVAELVMSRRGIKLEKVDQEILTAIFELTVKSHQ
ncbi:MAG: glucose-1-phosphate thymidylyltransferase [Flavobacteriales bacterium CG_4_10_14_0_2_um_filter_32_8]|nr:MAG: glucose-1-phosphate thymidylyltransferase [Flavobacteriales bacterium CG_4_10_14_0_2_um_filter_32_8]